MLLPAIAPGNAPDEGVPTPRGCHWLLAASASAVRHPAKRKADQQRAEGGPAAGTVAAGAMDKLRLPVSSARRRKLADLAERVRQLQSAWRSTHGHCPTGLAKLDAALGGGFALGAIHELLAPADGAAARSLALWVAARAIEASFTPPTGEAPTAIGRSCRTSHATCISTVDETTGQRPVPHAAALPTDRLEPVGQCHRVYAVVDDREHPHRASRLQPDFSGQGPSLALRALIDRRVLAHGHLGSAQQRAARWVFYIDTGGDFYPPVAAQLGVPLERLLIIHTHRNTDALWVCEQALRCKAVAAVVLPIRAVDAYVSRRLQLAAEASGGLGFLLRSEARGGHTFAATRLRLDPLPTGSLRLPGRQPTKTPAATKLDPLLSKSPTPCHARDGAPVRPSFDPLPMGDAAADDFHATRRMRVTLLKLRDGRPAEPFELALPDAAIGETTLPPASWALPFPTRPPSPYPSAWAL